MEEPIKRPLGSLAKQSLELGEEVFNGVEIRGIGRQIKDRCTPLRESLFNSCHLVRTQVIGHHDISLVECWAEHLADILQKGLSSERAI